MITSETSLLLKILSEQQGIKESLEIIAKRQDILATIILVGYVIIGMMILIGFKRKK